MSVVSRFAPLVATVVGVLGIGGLWCRRIALLGASWEGLAALAAGLVYASWIAYESRISAHEVAREHAPADRATMELAAVAKLVLLVATLGPASRSLPAASAFGGALLLGGIALRLAAVRRLAGAYSHRIRPLAGPPVDGGPYRWVRHPAYAGTLAAHAALTIMFPSVWSLGALTVAWVPAVVVRAAVEDRFLRQTPEYEAYAAKVRFRLLPGVY